MKIHLFWTSILLIILGCELIPEALDPPDDESIKKEYLQPGDTLYIPIQSLINENTQHGSFSITDLGDTNIVSLNRNDSMITVIGKDFGSTIITAHFNDSDKYYIIYLNFIVLEGYPVFTHVGEEITINPIDYFESINDFVFDSIYLSSDEEFTSFNWENENNQNLILTGMKPGTQKVLYSCVHPDTFLQVQLFIETSVRQVVLGEVFTNDGCIPCVPVNHLLDEILFEQNENITMIRYHWTSPNPGDPMYHYNSQDVEFRRVMFNVIFCPVVVISGVHVSNGQDAIENNVPGNILSEMTNNNNLYLGHIASLNGDSIIVDLQIIPFETITESMQSWAVVVEDSIYHEGYNGETIHMQVMRDVNSGEEWNVLEKNVSYSSQISLSKPGGYSDGNSLFHIITMIQSASSNQIIQSNRFHLPLNSLNGSAKINGNI